ncbi:YbaB/EbfC family nucleoid-associated protein [Micromonospora sp. NPDC049107]|uniref:YbaB/EbfC family nucleoid-associated protein n=1 Tax=Micromonospora sp. NPDC049107 TaxID=3154349 RepID=UPI0033D048F3
MTSTNPNGIHKVLTDTLRALSAQQSGGADGADVPQPEGHGEAADGMVRATAAPPGRLTALEVDPGLRRLDLTTLTEHILTAVNDAMADLQQATTSTTEQVDLSDLGRQLTEIQRDAARQFTTFLDGLADAQDRLGRRGG